ncbi:putative 40S ribosomal protein S3-1 [Iris pallida]|uniref:40S ribosomal protein S3-1 n=1 Tax=Iris pallida TaxID=29817 RepID=A0AAX6FEV7_IRIPA|nr:putative 40S ribosomal protein S3-1 [Iris pallida]KAJ6818264.1 putative 40S ribosomal protein S3-1 [Iris pallida]
MENGDGTVYSIPLHRHFQLGVGESDGVAWLKFEEDAVASDDSSSNLFELENPTAGGRFRNELPVFQTRRGSVVHCCKILICGGSNCKFILDY